MVPTRRDVFWLAAAAAVSGGVASGSAVASNGVAHAISAFTKGAVPQEGAVLLEAPEIADNGGSVPIRLAASGARRIALFADGNPSPGVAVATFGRLSTPEATLRIRLAGSQNLIAVAEMADGTFRKVSRPIIVTVGGCG